MKTVFTVTVLLMTGACTPAFQQGFINGSCRLCYAPPPPPGPPTAQGEGTVHREKRAEVLDAPPVKMADHNNIWHGDNP